MMPAKKHFIALFTTLFFSAVVHAGVFVVDATEATDVDPGTTTLNEALEAALANADDDIITFSSTLANTRLSLANHSWNSGAGSKLTLDGSGVEGLVIELEGGTALLELGGGKALEVSDTHLEIKNLSFVLKSIDLAITPITFIDVSNGELSLDNVSLNGVNAFVNRPRIGINAHNSKVTLTNSTISAMHITDELGSAINFVNDSGKHSLKLTNSNIRNNGMFGASSNQSSIRVESNHSNISIIDSTISANNSFSETAGLLVLAENDVDVQINIKNSLFLNNRVWQKNQGTAALSVVASDAGTVAMTIHNSVFSGNSGGETSQLAVHADTLDAFNATITNSSFIDGSSSHSALAFHDTANADFSVTMVHNTITANHVNDEAVEAASTGVSLFSDTDTARFDFLNSIAFDNSNADLLLEGMIHFSLEHSLVGIINSENHSGTRVEKKALKGVNPLFEKLDNPQLLEGLALLEELELINSAELSITNICLQANSPARNTGNSTFSESFKLKKDLSGNSRMDDKQPDMGTLEYQSCNPETPPGPVLFKKTKGHFGFGLIACLLFIAGFKSARLKAHL